MSDITTVTPLEGWKSPDIPPTTLPSGKVARLKAPGMESFLTAGTVPNSLIGPMTHQLEKAKKGQDIDEAELEAEARELLSDPESIADIVHLANVICISAFVEPKVWALPPEPGDDDDPDDPKFERRADRVYVDEIDMDDKFFVMNFAVAGVRKLEPFRNEPAGDVGAVQPGKAVAKSTKRAGRTTPRKS